MVETSKNKKGWLDKAYNLLLILLSNIIIKVMLTKNAKHDKIKAQKL